nr:tRNA-splicing endonuclease subunit Sen34 isoform X2 [Chelonoidis abingdonii]
MGGISAEFTPLGAPLHGLTPLRAIPSPNHPPLTLLPAHPQLTSSAPCTHWALQFAKPPPLSTPARVLANGAVAQLREPRPLALQEPRDQPACFANTPQSWVQGSPGVKASEVEAYQQELEESYQEQQRLAGAERGALLARLAERIAQGRAHRREQRGEMPDTEEDSGLLDSPFVLPRGSMMIQLPTARWRPGRVEQVDWTSPSPDWPHAGRPAHEVRYRVFRELWGRGYYLSGGSKFGGDFLVYPGDPLRFHAHYIALCCPPEAPLPLHALVAATRLGTSVKKTLLLCSPGTGGTLAFTSLQWSGLQ